MSELSPGPVVSLEFIFLDLKRSKHLGRSPRLVVVCNHGDIREHARGKSRRLYFPPSLTFGIVSAARRLAEIDFELHGIFKADPPLAWPACEQREGNCHSSPQ
jgi:hypothetical protein